jgi:protein-S-isoprenylcysteine O-methyltransferase Ste14
VTTGMYKRVRHPLYLGILISCNGLGIFSWNIWFTLMTLCFGLAFTMRIPTEEAELRKKYKNRYTDYANHTGLIFPRFRNRS